MANSSKGLWLVVVLVAAGAVIFALSFKQKPQAPQGVVLQEIFSQQPAASGSVAAAPQANAAITDPVKSPAIVTDPTNGHEAGFAVQVYSFQDKSRAVKALENLKAGGYKAFLVVSDLGEKGTWYRIRVGGIADEKAAEDMLQDVRKNYKSGFIVKPKV